MKVLLLKDAKDDDSGQDPYIQVSGWALFLDPWTRTSSLMEGGVEMLKLGELGA